MDLDPLFLSRLQFAFVIAFHFLLPAFTIGLASYIAVLEGLYLSTRKPVYLRISNFWIKIFAGLLRDGRGLRHRDAVPVRHQLEPLFGCDRQYRRAADGLRGPDRVLPRGGLPRRAAVRTQARAPVGAFRAAFMVAVGTLFSTFWILVLNSWMQTPVGFKIVDGRFMPTDWLAILFNPSFPFRFLHTVVAVYLTTAFTVIGVAAYYLRGARFVEESKVMIVMGVVLASVLVPLQALIGDAHGLNTLDHQPQKLAAMEGHLGHRARDSPPCCSPFPTAQRRRTSSRSRSRSSRACISPTTGTASSRA